MHYELCIMNCELCIMNRIYIILKRVYGVAFFFLTLQTGKNIN